MRHNPYGSACSRMEAMYRSAFWNSSSDGWKTGASSSVKPFLPIATGSRGRPEGSLWPLMSLQVRQLHDHHLKRTAGRYRPLPLAGSSKCQALSAAKGTKDIRIVLRPLLTGVK
jgi:hypothetical protein